MLAVVAEEVAAMTIPPQAAIVFGSVANERHDATSDVDLGLVVAAGRRRNGEPWREETYHLVGRCAKRLALPIEILDVTLTQLRRLVVNPGSVWAAIGNGTCVAGSSIGKLVGRNVVFDEDLSWVQRRTFDLAVAEEFLRAAVLCRDAGNSSDAALTLAWECAHRSADAQMSRHHRHFKPRRLQASLDAFAEVAGAKVATDLAWLAERGEASDWEGDADEAVGHAIEVATAALRRAGAEHTS